MRFSTFAFALVLGFGLASQANAQSTVYSNITTFTGNGYASAGSVSVSGDTTTLLAADDINFVSGFAGQGITGFTFSVANFNSVAVSARALVRFYGTDGTGGGPGTLLAGFNFNPITFAAGNVQLFTYAPGTSLFTIPTSSSIWAGIAFDNNSGATGATAAQLNNLGQGLYNPPTVGRSQDAFFQTSAASAYTTSNPAGGFLFFGGSPVANFGWAFTAVTPAANPPAVPEPGSVALLAGIVTVGAGFLRRRVRVRKAM